MMMESKDSLTPGELFDLVWKENKYHGFSHQTSGESTTPFLDTFINELPSKDTRVVELGAGSCDHAIRMAKEKHIKEVTAVEYSQTAVDSARERIISIKSELNAHLIVQCDDLFTFLNQTKPNSLEGIYANSVFHFLTPKQRQHLYYQAYQSLVNGGIIAVSFKTIGDALYKRGQLVEETAAGPIIRDSTDHICRLFASPMGVDVLASEIQSAGFNMKFILKWSVSNYNIEGEDGQFVGFIASRQN